MRKNIKLLLAVICFLAISTFAFVYAGWQKYEPFSNFTSLYVEENEITTDTNKVHLSINADFNITKGISVNFVELDENGNPKDMSKDLMLPVKDLTTNPYVELPNRVLKENNTLKMIGVDTFTYDEFYVGYLYTAEDKYDTKGKDTVKIVAGTENVKKGYYWNISQFSLGYNELSVRDIQEDGNKLSVNFTADMDNISKITCTLMERGEGGVKIMSDDLKLDVVFKERGGYILLPERVVKAGTNLEIYSIEVTDKDNKSIVYSEWIGDCIMLSGSHNLTITEWKNKENEILKYMRIKNAIQGEETQVGINGKVVVEYKMNTEPKRILLSFVDEANKNSMTVYLKGINTSKPYFVVPYTTKPGTYTLKSVSVTDILGANNLFEDGKSIDFNTSIKILETTENGGEINLDNDKITSEIVSKINASSESSIICINANNDPIVNKSVFAAIKGTNKVLEITYNDNQWVFSGLDITEAKDVDVSSSIANINYTDSVGILSSLKDGMILEFADNGKLPGKCLIRLAVNETLSKHFGDSPVYVYYCDENGNKLDKVAMKITLTDDGYYEFYINHNSKYLLTSSEVDSSLVSNNTELLSLNEEVNSIENSNNIFGFNKESLIVVVMAVVIIILLIVIFVISRKNNRKNN